MSVPFQAVARHAALAVELVNQLGDASRQLGARIAYAETHRITQPDFNGLLFRHLLAHLHQPVHERQHEPFDVGTR